MKSLMATIVLLLATAATAASASSLDPSMEWKSGYIPGKGSFTVRPQGPVPCGNGEYVEVLHDRNKCSLNALGYPDACTVMGFEPATGLLKLDEANSNSEESLFKVEGTKYEIVTSGFERTDVPTIRLLVTDSKGQVIDAITLRGSQRNVPQIHPPAPGKPVYSCGPTHN